MGAARSGDPVPRIAILGGRGFVGSAFVRACKARDISPVVIGREESEGLTGSQFDVLVNANGNSSKILATRDPIEDFDKSVRRVRRSLIEFESGVYVYLSTCDVYPDCSSAETTREDSAIRVADQSAYGFHKWIAEETVRHAAGRWLIFRLGGMVGPGLRKNAVFDVLNGGPVWLDPGSRLQFMVTDRVAGIVLDLVERGIQGRTLNLCGKGTVRVRDMMEWSGRNVSVSPGAPLVTYDVSTAAIAALASIPSTEETVREFIRARTSTAAPSRHTA
jgi:nucleoside-diphosphate-sugar epimerase